MNAYEARKADNERIRKKREAERKAETARKARESQHKAVVTANVAKRKAEKAAQKAIAAARKVTEPPKPPPTPKAPPSALEAKLASNRRERARVLADPDQEDAALAAYLGSKEGLRKVAKRFNISHMTLHRLVKSRIQKEKHDEHAKA